MSQSEKHNCSSSHRVAYERSFLNLHMRQKEAQIRSHIPISMGSRMRTESMIPSVYSEDLPHGLRALIQIARYHIPVGFIAKKAVLDDNARIRTFVVFGEG